MSDTPYQSDQWPGTPDGDAGNARVGPAKIRDLYDVGTRAIRAESMRYWTNICFLQGEQWIYYSSVTNRLEQMPRDDSRVRGVFNRMASTFRRLIAKSTKRELVFEVPPSAADDASVEGARISESILESERVDDNWEGLREEVTIACLSGGTGLLCLDWNPSGGDPLETDEESGRQVGTGAAEVSALSLVEAVTEPGTRDIEYAQWWIKAQAIPAKEVKETYKLSYTPQADAAQALSPIQRMVLEYDRAYMPQDLCLVLTYYERPCQDYPDGQVCVVVGSQIVDGPYKWPFPFTDRLNVTAARETKVLGRWTGDTILSQAVPVQTVYNMVMSALTEHCKLAGNTRMLWPIGAGDSVDSLSDLPAEIIEYLPQQGLPGPDWMNAPQLPAGLYQYSKDLEAIMDDILGVHDISRGEAPRNVQSGSGLAILAEQDDTPIGHVTKEVGSAFARLGSMLLETYAAEVTDTRMARVDYPHQVSQTVPWNGKSIEGQTTVIVPYDQIKPITEAEIWTKATELTKIGAFHGSDGLPDPRLFARYLAANGGESNFTETIDPDVAKASREDAEMALGEPKLPAPFDNDAKHVDVHNDFRKTQRYEQLDPQSKQIIDWHVQAHEVQAAEKVAQQQNQLMQGGPDLAAAPSATIGGNPIVPQGVPPTGPLADQQAPFSGPQGAPGGTGPGIPPVQLQQGFPDLPQGEPA